MEDDRFLRSFEIINYVLISDFWLYFVIRCDNICDSVLNVIILIKLFIIMNLG